MKNGSLFGSILIVVVIAIGGYFLFTSAPKGTGSVATTSANGASAPLTFYCGEGATMRATFATSSLALHLSDGRNFSLNQVRSGSGMRYEATTTGSDLLFVGKRDAGSFTNSASTTDMRYATCAAASISAITGGRLIYENLGKSFTFTFPANFFVTGFDPSYTPGWSAPATTTGQVLAKIMVPKSFEPGTNFADAWLTVGTSADPQSVSDCTKSLSGVAGTQVAVGPASFTKLEFTGAGAGNRYDTTSYRVVRNNQCYAVEYTIHYSVLANFPKGTVQAFDEARVTAALDEVAKTFRFTN